MPSPGLGAGTKWKGQTLVQKLGLVTPLGCVPAVCLLMKRIGRKEYWRAVGNELCKGNQTHQSGKKIQE